MDMDAERTMEFLLRHQAQMEARLAAEMQAAAERHAQAEQRHALAMERLDRNDAEISALTDGLNALARIVGQQQNQIEGILVAVSELTKAHGRLVEDHHLLAEAARSTENRLALLTQRLDTLTQRMDALTQRVDSLARMFEEWIRRSGDGFRPS